MPERPRIAHSFLGLLALAFACASSALAGDAPASPAPQTPLEAAPAEPPSAELPPGAASMLREMPAFRPGLWSYHRTVENAAPGTAQPEALRKCSDPIREIRQKMTQMMGKGCRLIGTTREGNRFRSAWSCPFRNGIVAVSDVIVADAPTSYQDVDDAHYGDKTAHSVIVATRIGDCDKGGFPEPPKGRAPEPGSR